MLRLRSALLLPFVRFSLLMMAALIGCCLTAAGQAQRTTTPAAPAAWVGTWATSPFGGDPWHTVPTLVDSTLREIVHTSIPGKALRVRFTNEFGTEPLRIDAASVALSAGESAIQPASMHALTFGGQASIVIPPGAEIVSDPVPLATPAFADLAISFFLPLQQISDVSVHSGAGQVNYVLAGSNAISAASLTAAHNRAVVVLRQRRGRRAGGREGGRCGCIRGLDHRRSLRHRQREPSLARLPGGAAAQ